MKSLKHLDDTKSEHAHQVGLLAWCAVALRVGQSEAFAWADGTGHASRLADTDASFWSSKPVAPTDPLKEQRAAAEREQMASLRWLFAIPNGGARGANAAITGAALKAEGVRAGVADLMLPCARGEYHGLFIEMKKPTQRPKRDGKGGLSAEQIAFCAHVRSAGYCYAVCYNWREAAETLAAYLTGEVKKGT